MYHDTRKKYLFHIFPFDKFFSRGYHPEMPAFRLRGSFSLFNYLEIYALALFTYLQRQFIS
ncbi:MAG: hypothetical protein AB7W47_10980 [Calditrichaceae bacterium]